MSDQYPQPNAYPPPTPPAGHEAAPQYVVAAKSKFVAAMLALFLGTLGVHNLYLGYSLKGIIQLIIGVLGYATAIIIIGWFLLIPLGIWVIVEFFLILFAKNGKYSRSANGVPLS